MREHLLHLASLLRAHRRALAVLAITVLVPLFLFADIAEDVYRQETLAVDEAIMRFVHRATSDPANHVAASFSIFGSAKLMLPVALFLFALCFRRRRRLGWFVLLSLGGVASVNFALKQFFDRPRPDLWVPFLPEEDSSFPSGHSMFASALACTVLVLLWHTRFRILAVVLGVLYTLGMMLSRVYIGVHYPTDVVAGALFSLAWVVGLARILHLSRTLHAGKA